MKHLSKRLLALLLAALLSVSLCVPALAANESNNRGAVFSAELDKPTVYVSDQEQTVVVSIKVNQKITLDSFEADVVEEGGIKGTAVSSQDLPGFQIGSGKVAWMSFTPDNYETDHICDITFTIPANTPAGTYTLGLKTLLITADIFQGSDEYWEDTAVATATLTITCPHTAKTEHPAVAATCTEPGSEVYYTCDACGQMLDKDGNAIDAIPVVDAWATTAGTMIAWSLPTRKTATSSIGPAPAAASSSAIKPAPRRSQRRTPFCLPRVTATARIGPVTRKIIGTPATAAARRMWPPTTSSG